MKSIRFLVTGRVQGVGFRRACEKEAARIGGLAGWIRNLESGQVEIMVQGEDRAVETLALWCSKGSTFSRVEKIERFEEPQEKIHEHFEVKN